LKIINTLDMIQDIFSNGSFDLKNWRIYIEKILPSYSDLFINDMNNMINTGKYHFKKDFLPILNLVHSHERDVNRVVSLFDFVTQNLEQKIVATFGKSIDVDIILYLGLCNGAGWAIKIDNKQTILLGIEKIMELQWFDLQSMYGLIYHELGHIYQMQYGILERNTRNHREQLLWQLFTEGIAMYFEQILIENSSFFHQDSHGWLKWCENHFDEIRHDFTNDLDTMTKENQRYFGDWVTYKDYSDVGYYLGAKFIWFLSNQYELDEIILLDMDDVIKLLNQFISNPKEKI